MRERQARVTGLAAAEAQVSAVVVAVDVCGALRAHHAGGDGAADQLGPRLSRIWSAGATPSKAQKTARHRPPPQPLQPLTAVAATIINTGAAMLPVTTPWRLWMQRICGASPTHLPCITLETTPQGRGCEYVIATRYYEYPSWSAALHDAALRCSRLAARNLIV